MAKKMATHSTSLITFVSMENHLIKGSNLFFLERYKRLWKTQDNYVPQDGVRMSKDGENIILLKIDGVLEAFH